MAYWKSLIVATFVAIASFVAAPNTALAAPCAEPVTFLKICCPKPCPITDPKKFVENAMKQVLEDLKLASIVKEALAWKEQLDQWGKSISSITNLISSLLGQGASGLSAISPPTLIPNGLNSNPLNISQTAGQLARLFTQPSSTISESAKDQSNRANAITEGFTEALAVAFNARNALTSTAEELKKLGQVVAKSQGSSGGLLSGLSSLGSATGTSSSSSTSSTSGSSSSKDDESVRSELAVMNQVRIAMLQALQNQTNITTAWNSAEGYEAVARLGPDRTPSRASWGTPDAPASPYGSLQEGIQKSEDAAFGSKDAAIEQRSKAAQSFADYDNLVERAMQAHNAAASYVSMMETVALNQETVAHYELSREMANGQRANITNGLRIFYADPVSAFSKMATEAIGANSLGGINPYQWGDSYAQQGAGAEAMNNLVLNAISNPGKYGATTCVDVPETDGNGYTRPVAYFTAKPPTNAPTQLLTIYGNMQRQACGALLATWVSSPVAPVFDEYAQTNTTAATADDINPTRLSTDDATAKAMEELLKDNPNAGMDQAFKYWASLQKRTIWYYDLACGTTAAADPRDNGACELYNKSANPNARAGGAQGTINNLYRSIDDMVDTLNDPSKTTVLNAAVISDREPINVTSYQGVRSQIDSLLAQADTMRSLVDPAIMAEEHYHNRDDALKRVMADMRNDTLFKTWVSSAPSAAEQSQCTSGCWGTPDADWNETVTVNGLPVATQPPTQEKPVVRHQIDCSDQSEAVYCQPIEGAGAPWPIRPQTQFTPTIMVKPPYMAD